jgi:O-antigen ligase
MKRPDRSNPSREKRDTGGSVLFCAIALAVLASWLALDPRSIDAFAAPKVVLAQMGIATAAAAALGRRLLRPSPFRIAGGRKSRIVLALFGVGFLGAVVSSLASKHPARSLDTLRSATLFLLALGVGASVGFSKRLPKITALLAAAATINAVLVILAALGLYSPLVVFGQTNRSAFGALVGNAGHLGICLALAAVALVPSAVAGRFRWPARAALTTVVAGILATQTLSGLATLAGGGAVYLVVRFGRRASIPIALSLVLLAFAVLMSRGLRLRVRLATQNFQRGDWNAALSARAAPWLAGAEMVRSHPWLGIGPGNFATEFIPNRIAAEARHRQRLVVRGMANNSFSEAHSDYLDLVAAIGVPAGACFLTAFSLLLLHLLSRGRDDPEAAAVGSGLTAGAVAAATWFPFQIVASGVWLVLLTGVAYRHLASDEAGKDR